MDNRKNVAFHVALLACCLFAQVLANAQNNIGIGTATPHSSALLDISSNTKGLLPPRMTSTQRSAIINPQKGLIVFDNTTASYWYFGDGSWKEMTAGGTSSDSTLLVGDPNPGPVSEYLITASSPLDTSGIVYDSGGEFGNYSNNENREFNVYSSLQFNAIGVKVTILQMNLENLNDSVTISSSIQRKYFTGTVAPQSFILNGIGMQIKFKSNGSLTAPGFKIRFDFIFPPVQQTGTTQVSGWTYLPARLAVRGGFDAENSSVPDSVGVLSFGYGRGVLAKGSYSVAMGDLSSATGINSISMGSFSKASGSVSIALGQSAEATGANSIAIGYNTNATANYAFATNYQTRANGSTSFAANNSTQANGSSSASFGNSSRAHGGASMTMGSSTETFGTNSVAMGSFTNAYGLHSLALGTQSNAVGVASVAAGDRTRSTGDMSLAMGKETVARSHASLSIGQYNDSIISADPNSWMAADPAFIIGNGTSNGSRRNAFLVMKDGKTGLNIANGVPQALLHLKGTLPSSYDSHIRLESPGASTDYATILYDGDMKFRTFGASNDFQWRNAAGNTRMTLTDAGNLSIAGVLSQNSDARLKKNIIPLQNSLQKILQLNGYHYHWIEAGRDNQLQSGLLAQEVEKQMPELVTTDRDGFKSVNYISLLPHLIEALKTQQEKIEKLEKEIGSLKQIIKN